MGKDGNTQVIEARFQLFIIRTMIWYNICIFWLLPCERYVKDVPGCWRIYILKGSCSGKEHLQYCTNHGVRTWLTFSFSTVLYKKHPSRLHSSIFVKAYQCNSEQYFGINA